MSEKLSITANFNVLMNAAERYLAQVSPTWKPGDLPADELMEIGYRLAQMKAKGDFATTITRRTKIRRTASPKSSQLGATIFKLHDPARPSRNLMRRRNLRRRPTCLLG